MSATLVAEPMSARVRRKPAPSVLYTQPLNIPLSQPQPQPHQYIPQASHKLSFSEKYPDPDPTDPFAPLWVLRNRTSSALHRDALPASAPLLQRDPSFQDEFGFIQQADRRRSISYLQTLAAASTRAAVSDATLPPGYASDHGHNTPVRTQRACSIDGHGPANSVPPAVRRQSLRPTPLSQLAIGPSVSTVPEASKALHISIVQQPENDSSSSESDSTRVGHSGAEDMEATPRPGAQQQNRDDQPHQLQQRPRAGSANKLARFLKPRKVSQSDSNCQNVRASIADIDRIRKASISPPIFSTVVWAGQGQDFLPIKDHPLQQTAIPIQGDTIVPVVTPEQYSPLLLPVPLPVLDPISSRSNSPAPLPPPSSVPPAITSRPSQTSHAAHTDETHSSFSFVHIPSTLSSPSLAEITPEHVRQGRPATAPLPCFPTGPGATIASPATMKIKRSTSRQTSRLPPPPQFANTSSPLRSNSMAPTVAMDEWDPPSFSALTKAASLPIIAESGVRINFGALFVRQRIVVVFIRHFWCPLCQDYMSSVASLTRSIPDLILGWSSRGGDLDPEKEGINEKATADGVGLESSSVKVVVISNGSYTMIGKYKQIFGAGALEVYTDPSLAVYAALGMGKDPASLPDQNARSFQGPGHNHGRSRSGSQAHLHAGVLAGGGTCDSINDGASSASKPGAHGGGGRSKSTSVGSGGYVKHGLMGGIAMVFVRALKVGMPVWEKGGDLNQLGGEFVFGPGLVCTYAHRMQTTKGHAPFEEVLRAAGVVIPLPHPRTLRSASWDKEREKEQDKKQTSLRKRRPSTAPATPSSKTRARGQTIDVVPVPIVPVSVQTSKGQQSSSAVPERKKSHRRRRSVARSSTAGVSPVAAASVSVSAKVVRQQPVTKVLAQPEKEERDIPAVTNVNITIPTTPAITANPTSLDTPEDTSITTPTDPEVKWLEERHRSLQKIKERKNARRGLSLVDERQATPSLSTSLSQSRSHSRSPSSHTRDHSRSRSPITPSHSRSPSGSLTFPGLLSPSQSTSQGSPTPQSRQRQRSGTGGGGMERTQSRPRRSGSGNELLGKGGRGTSSNTAAEDAIELRGVQSDTGMFQLRREMSKSIEGRRRGNAADDDDIVLLGRETRVGAGGRIVNLSREHLARREREVKEARLLAAALELGVGGGDLPQVQNEDDAETVSDKTLVHQ